jgi:uncharacterized membrane protein
MNHLPRIGRILFAIGLAAFGVQQFLYGDFIPGRAPEWPASLPGRIPFAYVTGALLIVAALAIALDRKKREAAVGVSAVVFAWALLRHLPLVVADTSLGGAWTSAGKALAFFGGALAIAGVARGAAVARVCLGLFFVLAGVQHFLFAPWVATLVPAWIPGSLFWTYFAGVALVAGGIGLNIPRTAPWAAALSGLMIFLWVFLLHVPRALAAAPDQSRNEWTAVFEAIAMAGLAWVVTEAVASRPRR